MITPEQYEGLPERFVALAQDVEDNVVEDICRRLAKENFFTKTAVAQMRSMVTFSGLSEQRVAEMIAEFMGKSQAEITAMYEEAMEQLIADEGYVFERLGVPQSLGNDTFRKSIINTMVQQAGADLRNLTGSLGFIMGREFVPLAQAYQSTLDFAVLQIQTGVVDTNRAIKQAIVTLTDSGMRTVQYLSGRTEQIDVAVRRSIVTGMHNLSGRVAEQQADDMGTSLFEVSAHSGARDSGSGFENHKAWQGKVYWYKTPVPGYESLERRTGYGDPAGLEGVNCRHSKHPFVDGISRRIYSDKDLANIDKPAFTFEGRSYNTYEATQMQRHIERNMRLYKRRMNGLKAAGFGSGDPTYDQASALLARWGDKYKKFSRAAGLRLQPERTYVV